MNVVLKNLLNTIYPKTNQIDTKLKKEKRKRKFLVLLFKGFIL